MQVPSAAPGSRDELPGRVQLALPITQAKGVDLGTNRTEVFTVELWRRCLPDGLVCRAGDLLVLDVQRYRPENLIFARNVRIKRPFDLLRERGRVRSVKADLGFGFVRSLYRSVDIYFRLNDLLVTTENPLTSLPAIAVGDLVTFDVDLDESTSGGAGGGGAKLKATRIQPLPPLPDMTVTMPDFQVFRRLSQHRLVSDVAGDILRVQERHERSDYSKTYGSIKYQLPASITGRALYPTDAVESLECFRSMSALTEVIAPQAAPSLANMLKKLVDEEFTDLHVDTRPVSTTGTQDSTGIEYAYIRLYRLSADEQQAKATQTKRSLHDSTRGSELSVPHKTGFAFSGTCIMVYNVYMYTMYVVYNIYPNIAYMLTVIIILQMYTSMTSSVRTPTSLSTACRCASP